MAHVLEVQAGRAVGHPALRPPDGRIERAQLAAEERPRVAGGLRRAAEPPLEQIEIRALDVPAIGVDANLAGVQLAPHAVAHVRQERGGGIGGVAVDHLLLDEPAQPAAAEQRAEHPRLADPNPVEHPHRLDPAQNLRVGQERRGHERMVVQKGHRVRLHVPRDGREPHPVLAVVLLLRREPAHDRGDVVHLQGPLADEPGVQPVEVVVRLPRRGGGLEQHRRDALEVLQPERRRRHRVGVADRLGQLAGVGVARTGGRETEPRRLVLLARPRVEGRPLVVRGRRIRDRGIAPPGCPFVVRADLRNQVLRGDAVLRLRDVVEARVVHQGRRMAHLPHPVGVAQPIRRVERARLHVVLEAEGVPHLVGHHVGEQLAHQRVRQRQRPGARVERPDLHEVPVAHQVHHVVMELDVRLQNLPGARVVHVGAGGVLDRRRQPADDRVAGVLGAPVGVLLGGGGLSRDHRVAEPGLLERRLPRLDALPHVRHPLRGGGGVYPVGDRGDRIGQRLFRLLLLEPPAGDVPPARRAVLLAAVVDLPHREIADPLVEQARHHRLLGQLDHAVVQHHRRAAGPHAAAGPRGRSVARTGRRRRGVGVGGPDLDVPRKRNHRLDERPVPGEAARLQPRAGAELRDLGIEQPGDVDHRRPRLGERLDVERPKDRIVVRGLDRLRDRPGLVGDDGVGHALQQDPVAAAVPLDHPVPERLSAVADPLAGARDPADPEKLPPQLVHRDLVEHLVVEAVHDEHSLVGLRLLGDHLVVGLNAVAVAAPPRPGVSGLRFLLGGFRRLLLLLLRRLIRRLILRRGHTGNRQTRREPEDDGAHRIESRHGHEALLLREIGRRRHHITTSAVAAGVPSRRTPSAPSSTRRGGRACDAGGCYPRAGRG